MSQRFGCVIPRALLGIATLLFGHLLHSEPILAAGRHSPVNRQAQEKAEKAARKACLTGDFSTGVSILADLFVESQNPVYVFNQGRCLEQNSRYKDAIARFEEFVRLGETLTLSRDDRESALKHIEDCKAKLPVEEKPQVAVAPPPVQPVTPSVQPDLSGQIASRTAPQSEPAKGGRGLVIGGIVTGGVGVAAVVAGVVFALKANNLVDEMQNKVDAYTSDKSSSQKTYATLAWVGYGVGAACIAAGAVLTVLGASRHGSGRTDVALLPAIEPGLAGAVLQGGF